MKLPEIYLKTMPLQKCMAGEEIRNLSDQELLAVIIGTGIRGCDVIDLTSHLIREFGGLRGIAAAGIKEIAGKNGIGVKKAIRLHAAIEMGKRVISEPVDLNHIDSPILVWQFLLPEMAGLQKEEFRVIILNNKNRVIKKSLISIGTISEAIVHPREVFREAIREGGSSIIIAHNHPSGVISPSREDIATTKRIAESGSIIGIPLLDHVIITDTSFLSMKEEGYL